ncbi:MAG: PEP-CTERM sorting domain-containing protein [Isosphaeraceae bacterium]
MQRMRIVARVGVLAVAALISAFERPASADLIRATPGRSFPDIAGDIGGSQTYVYDPATQTGTFTLRNAPHLISLGPSGRDLIPLRPNLDGTLYQTLRVKVDRNGRIVNSPLNEFEIRGCVRIKGKPFDGVLLRGTPTAFGIAEHDSPSARAQDIFGLNVKIESGKLASAFGAEAYLRIVPQVNSTFNGEFTSDFSGEKPMTNLLAVAHRTSSLGGSAARFGLVFTLAVAAGLSWPIARRAAGTMRRRTARRHCHVTEWASTIC